MAGEGLLVLFLLFGVAGTFALYVLISRETSDLQRMDRSEAERAVRNDVGPGDGPGEPRGRSGGTERRDDPDDRFESGRNDRSSREGTGGGRRDDRTR